MIAENTQAKPGRPKGRKNRRTVVRNAFLASFESTAEKAAAGDEHAQELFLNIYPYLPDEWKAA